MSSINHAQVREDDVVRRAAPQSRRHRLNVRIEDDLYDELQREAGETGMSLSAVTRLALREGLRNNQPWRAVE